MWALSHQKNLFGNNNQWISYYDLKSQSWIYQQGVASASVAVFQQLDFILYAAEKFGLKVIFALVGNWDSYEGIDQLLPDIIPSIY